MCWHTPVCEQVHVYMWAHTCVRASTCICVGAHLCVSERVYVCGHIPQHVCGCQSLWVLGSKLGLSGLVVGVFAP